MFQGLGRFCLRRRGLVLVAWACLLVVGFVFGSRVFSRLETQRAAETFESVRGLRLLDEHSATGSRLTILLDGPPVEQARAVAMAAVTDIQRMPDVYRVDSAWQSGRLLTSSDGRAGLITVDLVNDLPQERNRADVERVRARAEAIRLPGLTVKAGGNALVNQEVNRQVEEDTRLGELITLPLSLVMILFVFRGLAPALIPLVSAICSIAGALSALYLFSSVMKLDPQVVPVTTVLGLGLSLDYALLYVSRYREERVTYPPEEAVVRAAGSAGRAVGYSAVIVGVSLSGLFMFASPFFHAVGAAGVSVVTVAVLASLTLTPALLGTFAARIEPARESADGSGFARLAAAVRRRAGATVAVIGLLLVVAGLPFAWVRLGVSGAELLPKTMESRQVYETVKARFPGGGRVPVQVVARADAPALRTWLEGQWGHPYLDVETKARQLAPGLSTADLYTVGTGKDEYAQDLVEDLRAHRPPFTTYVSGSAAGLVDFRAELGERLPRAALLVVGGTFVMMFLLTGSVLVPVKTLVMNILSLCAVFGALVLVFQQGVLSGPLGFTPTGNLESWMPVLVFAFAFGLSMDYEVFLLARIKEFHDLGHPSDEAVALGLQRSGRIITSAALIMVVVFSGFAAGHMLSVKQLGLALALAVAVDATLVRCLLVPATMTLLGRWNWWAPPPLRRLYDRYRLVS